MPPSGRAPPGRWAGSSGPTRRRSRINSGVTSRGSARSGPPCTTRCPTAVTRPSSPRPSSQSSRPEPGRDRVHGGHRDRSLRPARPQDRAREPDALDRPREEATGRVAGIEHRELEAGRSAIDREDARDAHRDSSAGRYPFSAGRRWPGRPDEGHGLASSHVLGIGRMSDSPQDVMRRPSSAPSGHLLRRGNDRASPGPACSTHES